MNAESSWGGAGRWQIGAFVYCAGTKRGHTNGVVVTPRFKQLRMNET